MALFGKKKKKVVKPTAAEKVIILQRLKKQYPQMFEPGWGKVAKKGLRGYAEASGKPHLRGARGSDRAELQKIFGKKKKKK
jgi:hypothetical protein